jgi:hypothetical protein
VHPSWRDLVIDHVAGSPERRRAFLAACGLPGLELALSNAGGPTGTRRLPLVTTDEEWDALGDAIHRLCRVLAHDELARMLTAVEAATVEARGREGAELEAISEMALNAVRGRLDQEAGIVAPDLLERWHTLAGRLAEPPRPPEVGRTVAALDPTEVDPSDPASVRRLDDFLAVLEATGRSLPDGIDDELTTFVAAAEQAGELSPATRATLRRLARVHPRLRGRIWPLLDDEDAARQVRTAMPEKLAPPPPDVEAERVRRILADL